MSRGAVPRRSRARFVSVSRGKRAWCVRATHLKLTPRFSRPFWNFLPRVNRSIHAASRRKRGRLRPGDGSRSLRLTGAVSFLAPGRTFGEMDGEGSCAAHALRHLTALHPTRVADRRQGALCSAQGRGRPQWQRRVAMVLRGSSFCPRTRRKARAGPARAEAVAATPVRCMQRHNLPGWWRGRRFGARQVGRSLACPLPASGLFTLA